MSAGIGVKHDFKVTIVQFPGSNCDVDCARVFSRELGAKVNFQWHTEVEIPPVDLVVIPGGFSFGDYLRSGALAAHAPVIEGVRRHVKRGGGVIGICNGFQILTESGLLPGALLANDVMRFVCKEVELVDPENNVYKMPIAHGEGRYYINKEGFNKLNNEGSVAFRYKGTNPNGSIDSIAGIYSSNKKILGMMPHPERAANQFAGGSVDGLTMLKKFLSNL
jgi:phosphoribosylformylglycinamidine synthase